MRYSQLGQDEWVIEKLGANHAGFFVDVGAHDGVRHSNTKLLEDTYGWTGLAIEANPSLCRSLEANRSCKVLERAVSGSIGYSKFILGDQFGGIEDYMPEDWKIEHERRLNPMVAVFTDTLPTLLDQCECKTWLDYLSLDVEGAEYVILEALVKSQYQFRLMTVEFRYDQLLLERMIELLADDYELDQIMDFDACFINRRLCV